MLAVAIESRPFTASKQTIVISDCCQIAPPAVFDPIGTYRKVPTASRLVTSSMTSRGYDVILVTSQSSKSSHWKRWPGSTIRVDPFSTH